MIILLLWNRTSVKVSFVSVKSEWNDPTILLSLRLFPGTHVLCLLFSFFSSLPGYYLSVEQENGSKLIVTIFNNCLEVGYFVFSMQTISQCTPQTSGYYLFLCASSRGRPFNFSSHLLMLQGQVPLPFTRLLLIAQTFLLETLLVFQSVSFNLALT